MSYPFSLKEVSKMFNIPITTLRYWEKHGLIQFQRNDCNNYKEFFFDDLSYVCDIDIYHYLGFNRNELKNLYSMDLDRMGEILDASEERALESLKNLRTMLARIEKRRGLFERVKALAASGYVEADINIEKVVSLSDNKEELIQYGRQFLTDFSLIMEPAEKAQTLRYGFSVPADFPFGNVIFEKPYAKTTYIKFLMKLPLESMTFPYERTPFTNYEKPHVEKITQLYSPPKKLILQFLLVANDPETSKPCFYEEAYAEI